MKEVVTKDNYKRKVLGRMITVCWTLLLICFVVKIFGGNFFAFIGESSIIEYIEQRWYLIKPIQCLFYMLQSLLFVSVLYDFKHKKFVIISSFVLAVIKNIIRLNAILMVIAFVLEFLFLILLPMIVSKKPLKVIVVNLLLVLFQMISLMTKNIGLVVLPTGTIVMYAFMIDYYIMLILMHLYFKLGGLNIMEWGFWFLSNDEAQLNEYKKHLEAKKAKKKELIDKKYNKKIAAVNTRIEKVNSKKK